MSVDEKPASGAPSTFDDGCVYDLMDQGNSYGLDFYVDLAREAKGPVLDVACATGRIFLPCLRAGVDIDGLDFSGSLLERLREKASAEDLSARLHEGDMGAFSLPRRYALIMIPCNSFVHNLTQEAQVSCLRCCREHLVAGGVLVFDTSFPSLAIVGAPQNTRVLEGEILHPETGLPVRMYDTRRFDRVEQMQHSINELEFLAADGSVQGTHRSQVSGRFVYKQEMGLLLRVAGFSRWEICCDFGRQRALTCEDDEMVVTAWGG